MRDRMMQLAYFNSLVKISDAARKTGVRAYLVGGFVRDLLIGRTSKDIDVCVIGHPSEETARRLVSSLPETVRDDIRNDLMRAGGDGDVVRFLSMAGGSIALAADLFLSGDGSRPVVYTRFLTAMSAIDGTQVEFTGARHDEYGEREGGGSRSRNPASVRPADERTDARRRDFTINALFVDLDDWGLVDPTGMGMKDIEDGIIRVTRPDEPDVVFNDDPLRMLRAIRFSVQLGYRIDNPTMRCIRRLVDERGHEFFSVGGFVSAERIRDELSKMLLSRDPMRAIKLMSDTGLLAIIMPEVQALRDIGSDGHKDIWFHTMMVMRNAIDLPDDLIAACEAVGGDALNITKLRVALAALLHDIGKVPTRDYGVSRCAVCGREMVMLGDPERPCPCGEIVRFKEGKVSFHDHHVESARMAKDILYRMKFDGQMAEWVGDDCFKHMLDDTFLSEGTVDATVGATQKQVPIERLINRFAASRGEYDPKWGKVNELTRWHLISSDATGKERRIVEIVSNLRAKAAEIQMLRMEEAEAIRANKPLIDGNELMRIFGLGPGEWIGEVHRRMRKDRLDNPESHDVERAMEIARSVVLDLHGP